jgi:hypothetical protein
MLIEAETDLPEFLLNSKLPSVNFSTGALKCSSEVRKSNSLVLIAQKGSSAVKTFSQIDCAKVARARLHLTRRDEDARPANSIKTQPSVINPVKYGFTSCCSAQRFNLLEPYFALPPTAPRTLTVAEWACGVIIKCKEQKGPWAAFANLRLARFTRIVPAWPNVFALADWRIANDFQQWWCAVATRAARNLPHSNRSEDHCAPLWGEKRLYVFNYHTPLRVGTPINYQTLPFTNGRCDLQLRLTPTTLLRKCNLGFWYNVMAK